MKCHPHASENGNLRPWPLMLLLAAAASCVGEGRSPVDEAADSSSPPSPFVFADDAPAVGSTTAALLGPEGGALELGGLKLELAAGALASAEEITVVVEDGELPGEGLGYSHLYRFGPEGLAFDAPVTVTIPFGGAPDLAAVFWSTEQDPDRFERVEAVFDGAYATFEVRHFSRGSVRNSCSFGSCGCSKDSDCTAGDIDKCDGSYFCDSSDSKCKILPATVVTCSQYDDTACSGYRCNPAVGQCAEVALNEGKPCDDGDVCTTPDTCVAGSCSPGADQCGCHANADCAAQEDGNLCNGTLYCDKSQAPFSCKVNPASTIKCYSADDTTCSKNTCNPSTGACQMQAQTGPCDDGESCTSGDSCEDGVCQSGEFVCACQQDSDCAAQEDGNLCNGTLYCLLSSHTCELNPATVISCPSVNDTTCAQNLCQSGTGQCAMTPAPNGTSCSDGNACTTGDTCQNGSCLSGAATCECTQDADCAALEDGDQCNGTMYCNAYTHTCVLNPATVIECPTVDDTACAKNTCQQATGQCAMSAQPNGTSCDDGDDCTTGDTCQAGSCQAGADQCECQDDADCAPLEDGDACNGTLYCDKSATPSLCIVNPGTVVTCDDTGDTECSQNSCDPATGQCAPAPVNEDGACDDGSSCTANDRCMQGSCAGDDSCVPCTVLEDCDILNVDSVNCEGYGCDTAAGVCVFMTAPDGIRCDLDGDSCTDDRCVGGSCQEGADVCGAPP